MPLDDTPEEFDWTEHLDPIIKNQGDYGSCWSFAAAEGVEMALWIAGKGNHRVSTRQQMECVLPKERGDDCCIDGDCGYIMPRDKIYVSATSGVAEDSYRYWYHKGFVKASDYPYQFNICKERELLGPNIPRTEYNLRQNCESSDYCKFDKSVYTASDPKDFFYHRAPQYCQNIAGPIRDEKFKCETEEKEILGKTKGVVVVSLMHYEGDKFDQFDSNSLDEKNIKEALYRVGPLTIYMNAELWVHYAGGIVDFDANDCPTGWENIDHVLQLVGYGTENGVDYWKVRNSWSPFFGERGYIRFKRGSNTCGITARVTAPMV